MNNRPFFSKTIVELEAMFKERHNERDFLEVLNSELDFRNVPRAKKLQDHVVKILNTNAPTTATTSNSIENKINATLTPMKELKKEPQKTSNSSFSEKPNEALKVIKAAPAPDIKNNPEDILSAWTAIEVLSPQSFKKPEDLVSDEKWRISNLNNNGAWIWEVGGESSQPKKRLYYQIVLGTILMEPSIEALLKVYTDNRVEFPQIKGEAVLATIMVNKLGCPIEEDPIAISSFGWGLPVALRGDLQALGQWQTEERRLIKILASQLNINSDSQQEQPPLTAAIINKAYSWLIKELKLDTSLIKPPAFAIKTYQYYQNNNPPESLLLNSFFLGDIGKASALFKADKAPANLKRYLGVDKPKVRHNLLTEKERLAEVLQPKNFPLSAWPSYGRHPLVLLQQCAVNLAGNLNLNGVLSVNGPPGTGKTTLLRDIVATIVTDRADIMVAFKDPESAFIHAGQMKKGQSFVHMYKLQDKLRGYEIVVASSNNKAVENVSAELPGIESISNDASELRYFKSVSDKLFERDTWGAIAAVLGNGQNRFLFSSRFWWDNDYGMQKYLQHISGTPQLIPDPENEQLTRPPKIVEFENPPSDHEHALLNWEKARQRYNQTKKRVHDSMQELQIAYELEIDIRKRAEKIELVNNQLTSNIESINFLVDRQKQLSILETERLNNFNAVQLDLQHWRSSRPGFLSRLLKTEKFKNWFMKNTSIIERSNDAHQLLKQVQTEQFELKEKSLKLDASIKKLRTEVDDHQKAIAKDTQKINDIANRYRGIFINQAFFSLSHPQKQMTVPWIDSALAIQRHELFEASINVQKAFVDAAAKPIRHNMNLLMDNFGMNSLGNAERDEVIPHLWSTLFLIVPVISTTFASIGRMFKNIGSEELGWLLIDEAGQALPQAAVGALFRTKKAVIVGDPIQIEPVVTLPNLLTESICRQFGINPLHFNAPSASTQTLADDTSAYFTSYETKLGARNVGVPLLVHRRCSSPMFEISNIVAYENLMVQAKVAKESLIMKTLGASRWIHLEGRSQDKWCNEEGEKVIQLLQQLKTENCSPELYIVTPFVVVQDRLRRLIHESKILEGWVENPRGWSFQRVGTVHTVQGREAEAVIFVLGASNPEQHGARAWAGGSPNLLNVAVTRSKEALYVIGNRELWKSAGHFQTLAKMLP